MFEKSKDFLSNQKEEQVRNLAKLWEEKRKFIASTLIELMQTFFASMNIKKIPSRSYKGSLERYKDRFQIADIKDFPLAIMLDSSQTPEDLLNNPLFQKYLNGYCVEDKQIKYFKLFLSPEYTPPDDNLKIIDHLQFLLFYYTDLVHSIPLEVTSRIDLVMAKLIQKTMSQIGAVDRKGRHKDIYTSGIETRKEIESSKTDYVANIYYRSKEIKHGMKLNTVAKEIEKELKEMRNFPFKKVPSLDRIKVYLMADSKIKKDFHKKGRFFVLHK